MVIFFSLVHTCRSFRVNFSVFRQKVEGSPFCCTMKPLWPGLLQYYYAFDQRLERKIGIHQWFEITSKCKKGVTKVELLNILAMQKSLSWRSSRKQLFDSVV